jgi:hypothetical protein
MTSIETWRKAWRELATTPQNRASLAEACKAARDEARTSLSAYGCQW